MVYLYQDRENKMIEQNEVFCEMKAVGKQFAKQWMDMTPHELRT
jgi:hypothetical protein